VGAGRSADRRLGVMLQRRCRSASRRLKALLDSNVLGDVQAATMTVPWWRPQSYYDEPGRGVKARDGGGVLLIQAIHTVDLFRWFLGIGSVDAAIARTTSLHRMETEDYATALVRLGNGAPGTIIATVAAFPGGPEQIMVIGSKGTARMEGSNLRISLLDDTEEVAQDAGGSGGGSGFMAFSHEPHKAVISDFLDAIEQKRDPAIPGEEALATQRVIETIIQKGA
jgi:predicted dehydrogenase